MGRKSIAVLGAGAIGVAVALSLHRDGHKVQLIDRDEPCSGASAGNAGLIQCASVVPVATTETLKSVPRMLLDRDQPLVVRWRCIPSLLPYLSSFLRETTRERVHANSVALASIIPRAYDAYRPLIEAAGIGSMVRHSGEFHVYETDAAFERAKSAHNIRQARGVRVEILNADETRDLEPSLTPAIRHGVLLPDAYQTTDPQKFVKALAHHFVESGGHCLKASVTDVDVKGPNSIAVETDRERVLAEGVVVALGAFSKEWVHKLGGRVPLDSERGYHVMLPNPQVGLSRTLLSGEYRFALSPVDGGIRLAGTAELARVGAAADYDRARRLIPLAQRLLPGLSAEGPAMWMGHRPSTPDSLPVIGRSPLHRHVYYAFGHGHSGFTLAGITGLLVADLVADRTPCVDLAPFRIDRFS